LAQDASAGSYALGMREDENVAWDEALDWEEWKPTQMPF